MRSIHVFTGSAELAQAAAAHKAALGQWGEVNVAPYTGPEAALSAAQTLTSRCGLKEREMHAESRGLAIVVIDDEAIPAGLAARCATLFA